MHVDVLGCVFTCQDRRHRSAIGLCGDEPSSRALTMLPGRLTAPPGPVTEEMQSSKARA